ncbi:unnamed protein product, partial [Mesorhabditis belari]|uniref:Uncharacterized protein n=1 Tax=Mesorhabditis belari TaxID=2138241 RepID=A0AAF3EV66_9BILA
MKRATEETSDIHDFSKIAKTNQSEQTFLLRPKLDECWPALSTMDHKLLFVDSGSWENFKETLKIFLQNGIPSQRVDTVVGLIGEKPRDFGEAPNLKQIKKLFMKTPGVSLLENAYESDKVQRILMESFHFDDLSIEHFSAIPLKNCVCDLPINAPPFLPVPIGPTGQCTPVPAFYACQIGSPADGLQYMLFDMNGNQLFDSGYYCSKDAAMNFDPTCVCQTVPAAPGNLNFPFCSGSYAPYAMCTNFFDDPTNCL